MTVWYVLLTVPIEMLIALVVAYVLYQGTVGRGAYRVVYFKDYWMKRPQGKQAFDLIPMSVAGPSIRGYQEVREALSEMLTKTKAKAEDALRDAATKANAVLKDNK